MNVRRVVTGLNSDGASCVWWDGQPPVVQQVDSAPGLATYFLWAAESVPRIPQTGDDPTVGALDYFPGPGGVRFIVVTHPPGSGVTVATSLRDLRPTAPEDEVHARVTRDDGVMHQTDTVDFGVILSGSISMGLDDGTEVVLAQGDTIIQTGVRHGWYNRTNEPCVMAFVIVGAERSPWG